jgi:hypothetical protein
MKKHNTSQPKSKQFVSFDPATFTNWRTSKTVRSSGRPSINAGERDLSKVTRHAMSVLHKANDPPRIFRHGNDLVRVEKDDHGLP